MNNNLLFLCLLLIFSHTFQASAQKKDYPTYETVFTTSDFESYWVYGTGINVHPAKNGDVPILELATGWVFDNKFMMGVSAGLGLVELERRMNQIELWVDKLFRPNKAVHPILSLSGGYSRQYKYVRAWRYNGIYSQNAYTINPMIGVQFNLADNMRMDTRIGYNVAVGVAQKQYGINNGDISSFTFSARILFGKFASFGN